MKIENKGPNILVTQEGKVFSQFYFIIWKDAWQSTQFFISINHHYYPIFSFEIIKPPNANTHRTLLKLDNPQDVWKRIISATFSSSEGVKINTYKHDGKC